MKTWAPPIVVGLILAAVVYLPPGGILFLMIAGPFVVAVYRVLT